MTETTEKALRQDEAFRCLNWAIPAWKDRSPVLLCTGSAGGGKSRFALEKAHALMMYYPGSMGIMLRKTRESIATSSVMFMEHTVMSPDIKANRVTHRRSRHLFDYYNGSVLAYGGMKDDEQREQIRSIGTRGGIDLALLEEANQFDEDDYNEVCARMRGKAFTLSDDNTWRQIILMTNPDRPTHWIKQRLMPKEHGGKGEASTYFSSARDNPNNPPEYLQMLESLTGVLGQRLRDGLWVQAEGAVYPEFDRDIHVIDRKQLPKNFDDLERLCSVDFGFTQPFVCQWWAYDKQNNTMYMYRELYGTKRLVEDWAKDIKRFSQDESIIVTVCDWDAEDRATIERNQIATMAADKRKQLGFQRVAERIRGKKGIPQIYFVKHAIVNKDPDLVRRYLPACTVEEIEGYVWDERLKNKEEPIKLNDHGMDAMRYAVMFFDRPKRGLFLWQYKG